MIITVLTGVKLYMKIPQNSVIQSELAVQFKTFAIKLLKALPIPGELRDGVGIEYLNEIYTRHINLVESSEILSPMNKKDQLQNC